MKCTLCKKEIQETFMGKIKGTYIKGKPYCSACQKQLQKTKHLKEKEEK